MPRKKKKQKRHPLLHEFIPKILMYSFIVIAAVQAVSSVYLSMSPEYINAAEEIDLNVSIGGTESIKVGSEVGTKAIADYIQIIYKYAIGVVGIIAAVVLMWGGVVWLTAGGNASRVGEAKAWIGAALTGLVLALGSYMILYQVNPDLVAFRTQKIETVTKQETDKQAAKGDGEIIGNCKSIFITDENWDKCENYMSLIKDGNDYYQYYTEESDKNYCNTGGRTDDEDNFLCCCKSRQYASEVCAGLAGLWNCKKCPEDLWPDHCKKCDDCVALDDDIVVKNRDKSSFVNSDLNSALKEALQNTKNAGTPETLDWRITEAWPPTVAHKSSAQYDGNSVDVGFVNANYNKTNVQAFLQSFDDAGLRAVYECAGAGCCANAGLSATDSNCWEDTGNHITGSHFSVYQ